MPRVRFSNAAILRRNTPLPTIISQEIANPLVLDDLRHAVGSRHRWKRVSDYCEAFAHLLLGLASILAFLAASYDQEKALLIANGIVSTMSIVLLKYSAYARAEYEERHKAVVTALQYFNVRSVPETGPGDSLIPSPRPEDPFVPSPLTSPRQCPPSPTESV